MPGLSSAPSESIRGQTNADGLIRAWLIVIAALVFAMVVVGGATRLTDSGLSITEWLPILGVIPPLNDADWRIAFEKYQQIPEYQQVNRGMSMDDFKFIYWWEWSHRFLGRFIGIAFALPLAVFWLMGAVRPTLLPKLLAVFALGGLQGFFGWYMVQSGLVDRVDVSHYRLALHLVTAFVILAALVWLILSLSETTDTEPRLPTITLWDRRIAWLLFGLVFLQAILGAFVAGTKAGMGYNTWPLMNGELIPDTVFDSNMAWFMNPLENVVQIQFNHRVVAYLLIALAVWHAISVRRLNDDERTEKSALVFLIALVFQAALGIWTLLAVPAAGGIPIGLGLCHQGGAAIVTAIATWHAYNIHNAR